MGTRAAWTVLPPEKNSYMSFRFGGLHSPKSPAFSFNYFTLNILVPPLSYNFLMPLFYLHIPYFITVSLVLNCIR